MSSKTQSKRLYDALILVVDDVEMNRRMLMHSLNAHGYHNVISANDGAEALQVTHEKRPDLVILDLMMPGVDGFAYCREVRKNKGYETMPILVQTALNEMEQKLKAFQHGANDYLCKPIDPGELSARTHIHLNQKILMEDLQAYQKRMTSELDSARKMQDRLMPTDHQIQMCERVFNMKIAHHFETSSALGGDCWGMRPLSDQRLAIYMFDFSGRGMTSAMNVFRMHTIIQELILTSGEPGQFLQKLNRQLHPLLGRDELATMFYGVLDCDANCLVYASASAPSAFLFTQEGATSLDGRGFPLGAIADATFDTRYASFSPGEMLVLYSDCIIETKNNLGEFLNDKQLQAAVLAKLENQPANPAQTAVGALVESLRQHNAGPIFDDNTINAYWRCR